MKQTKIILPDGVQAQEPEPGKIEITSVRVGVLVYLSGDDTSFTWVDETLWTEVLLWHAKLCLDEIKEDEFRDAVGYMTDDECEWPDHYKNPAPNRMHEHVIKRTHTQTWVLEQPGGIRGRDHRPTDYSNLSKRP